MSLTATEEALVRQLLDQQAAILSLAGNEATITSKLGATKATLADLVAASGVADADLLLTRQGTTDKSVRADILAAYMAAELNLSALAPKASPALTGTPTAPTATPGTGNTQIATTAFAKAEAASAAAAVAVSFASSEENAAGTVKNKAVDPLGIREAFNATGSAPVFACRAWVNFNGTGTVAIRASGNVSSITDNSVGDYTVNFTTALPDNKYSTVATSTPSYNGTNWSTGSLATSGVYSTTGVGVWHLVTGTGLGGARDAQIFNVAVFR